MAVTRPLAVLLLAATCPLAAQTRPRLTEEAATAPARSLVFESGFDWISNEPNPLTLQERTRWDGPLLRLVYSPSDNVEMDLEWVTAVGASGDPDFGSPVDVGDVSLRAKLRLVEEAAGRPGVTARFGVTLPETKAVKGLGPDELRVIAQLLLSRDLGSWSLHGNAGVQFQDLPREQPEQVDFFAWGLAIERRASSSLALVVEAAGRSGPGEPEARSRSEARVGARVSRKRCRFDAAVRRGLTQADGEWGASVGFGYRIR